MALHAIRNRSFADQIFSQLAAEILTGHHAPGANLPSERTLTDVFGVNRHVVREALKRLAQIGLVRIAHGGGTKVLDFRTHAGLDLLGMLAEHAGGTTQVNAYWLSILEMRAALAADIVRLCALRANDEQKAQILAAARVIASVSAPTEIFAAEIRFWDLVVEGAGNIAYRLALNSMVKSAGAMMEIAVEWSAREAASNGHRIAVAEAIAAGDAPRAEAEMRAAMRAMVEAFEERIASKRETPAP